MKFILNKIHKLRIGWNERPLTEADFYRLCRRYKITVFEMPLSIGGFYYQYKGGDYIALDCRLTGKMQLHVMFHEFAHYLMHVPNANETASFHGRGRKTRKEQEADRFALVALIPRGVLEMRSVDELIDEGFGPDMVWKRIEVYERYGI